ncbi:purine-cytosine permease family protein [Brachybacterium fresconis]|uniref:Purine-cytosine permease-like protein n=1 Tax=Brachybacterium fresconis TaxID=173363 RepID=A0ABS4YGK4_9MICO|nr:hypothetical protein [Brachybacterium fresconis]MBP2407745.1 purine-cytosine permease-like protein [Brachybacterium fresconis]
MSRRTPDEVDRRIAGMDSEQLPVGKHELHGAGHFAGLYAAENVAGTEFVFGATFVILGAGIWDVIIGLAVGNLLAVLTYRFITAPIATRTRMSVYTFLDRAAGRTTSALYNGLNAVVFAVISAAMITVSATALRLIFDFPAQTEAYPTSVGFIVLAIVFGSVAVLVAAFGFNALAEFASICGPWLMVMFAAGGIVLVPKAADEALGTTVLSGWGDFITIGGDTVFTGRTPDGAEGIGLLGVIGYAWAANSFAHAGLIDMSLLRYAKKSWYGYLSATGMFLGHYMAWVSAGFMGAATAAITMQSITVLEPGQVALQALGYAGFAVVIVGGWTTANANLYRAGLAGQGVFPRFSRAKVTLLIGGLVVIAAVFPFIYRGYLNLVTYAGIALVPIGGILFAEYWLLPRLGMTRYWARYKGVQNVPALLAWGIPLALAAVLLIAGLAPAYYLFPPVWLLSTVLYVLLARMMGAAERYPDGEADDELFAERVDVFHTQQAREAHTDVDTRDRRALTRVLKVVWIVDLAVIAAAALVVLLASSDITAYEAHRDRFFVVAAVGTVIYFLAAYGELRRRTAHTRRSLARRDGSSPAGSRPAD